MWVYLGPGPGRSERLWTVGFYTPEGTWIPESDHRSQSAAADRVHYLNGGGK